MSEISVVVCTYNRCEMLRLAMESLCQQALAPDRYEIIVVDNASTDKTREVVKEIDSSYPIHRIHYIYEPVPGLAVARNTGLAKARGEFVAYLDDDAKASSDWLDRALCLISTLEEVPSCIGGPILPFYTSPVPDWFCDHYELRSWGQNPRWLEPNESFSGSNMIWNREALIEAGGFDISRGVKAGFLSLGEESAVFEKIWQRDPSARFYYDPELTVQHWVPAGKMSVEYQLKRAFARGRDFADAKLDRHKRMNRLLLAVRYTIIFAISAIWAIIRVPFYKRWQNWAVEEASQSAFYFGRVAMVYGIRISIRQV